MGMLQDAATGQASLQSQVQAEIRAEESCPQEPAVPTSFKPILAAEPCGQLSKPSDAAARNAELGKFTTLDPLPTLFSNVPLIEIDLFAINLSNSDLHMDHATGKSTPVKAMVDRDNHLAEMRLMSAFFAAYAKQSL